MSYFSTAHVINVDIFQCFTVVERYEETIEDWYFEHQDQDIINFLCRKHVLKNEDQCKYSCVYSFCP